MDGMRLSSNRSSCEDGDKDTITWVSEVVLFMIQRYLLANLHAISATQKREAFQASLFNSKCASLSE